MEDEFVFKVNYLHMLDGRFYLQTFTLICHSPLDPLKSWKCLYFDEIHWRQGPGSQTELPLHGHVSHPLPELEPLEVNLLHRVKIARQQVNLKSRVIKC